MSVRNVKNLLLFYLLCLILAGCSKSDDQRRFEDGAFTEPRGITQTKADGDVTSEDPGDWNISPMYQALIVVQPVYPNPVDQISSVTLQIDQQVPDAVNEIIIYSFRLPTSPYGPIYEVNQSNIQLFNIINIPASSIAGQGAAGASDIYRVMVYDGHDNLITYGDVRVK